jgi:hypothetical protein
MAQTTETGRQGVVNGYNNADGIAALIGAVRVSHGTNDFRLGERLIVIKTGSSTVITESTLSRVDAIYYGEYRDGGWAVYEIAPQTYHALSAPSRSPKHDERYRLVRRTQIRQHGKRVV